MERPKIYETEEDIRFSDLDLYGHLNASRFLDIVATSRFRFIANQLNITVEEIIQKGVAFYLRKSEQHFKSPVLGVTRLKVRSWVAEMRDARLLVQYEVKDREGKVTHCTGSLEYVVVDPGTKKLFMEVPAWLRPYFFENA